MYKNITCCSFEQKAMKHLVGLILILIFTLSACQKKKESENINTSFISWYSNPDCWINPDPDFFHTDSSITAQLVTGTSGKELHINWPWAYTTITVTYNGIDTYSSDSTDLYIVRKIYDGLSTLYYRSDYYDCPDCGGYLEILSDDGEYVEGTIKYRLAEYSLGSMSTVYSGLDCATFKAKLVE